MRNRTLTESTYGLFKEQEYRDKKNIHGVNMVPSDVNKCRVFTDGSSVYSNAKFHCGDIVEICPARSIEKNSLYTKDVRDMAFEVAPDVFVIPMGYCQYYNVVDAQHPEPNCTYEWDAKRKSVVIRALCTVPKASILILQIIDESVKTIQ